MKCEEEVFIEEIIKIVRQIKNIQSIKMLYGFAKALKEKKEHNRSLFFFYCDIAISMIYYQMAIP